MHAHLINQDTGTITDAISGKTVYFGLEDFVKNIVRGNHCFVCGASPDEKPFNDEHVISNWILRKFNLHDRKIVLPNGTTFQYGSYTIPCCQECNSLLGKELEVPVRDLLLLPYDELRKRLESEPELFTLLFTWMSLVYLKTHLKDTQLMMNRDPRMAEGKIGDYYDWSDLHHIHCMARVPYTKAIVEENVYGTLLVVPALLEKGYENFDYMDNLAGQTLMIQLGGIAIIAVLNDSRACIGSFNEHFKKINGTLNPPQLRQLFTHMVHLNQNLAQRPKYHSSTTSGYTISATFPDKMTFLSGDQEKSKFGDLLATYIEPLLPGNPEDNAPTLEKICTANLQYLFDENLDFVIGKNT